MSIFAGPKIIEDGLVFVLDASNKKSYSGTGTDFFDVSLSKNTGTLLNGVGYNTNNLGAFVFDGSNDYISLNSPALLPVGTSDRTIIAFCKTPTVFSQTYLHVIHWGTPAGDQAFGMAIFNTGGLNTHPWFGAPSQGALVTNTKYGLAVSYTHSSTLHKFWINGVSQGNGVARAINTGTSTARVGARISTPAEYWGPNGEIYSIFVYNRSLSDEEIKNMFEIFRGRYDI
jgi:hypothetical protein